MTTTSPGDASNDYPTLAPDPLQAQLATSSIGHTLVYHTTVPSTMPIAAGLARLEETASGVVVIAEEQTSGRGRNQRTWHAPYAAALLVSIILKPPHTQEAATLTMLAGNALIAAVAAVAPTLAGELHLKWPNDLVLGRDPSTAGKVAGILAQSTRAPDGTLAYAILGIGTNVNQRPSDFPRIAPPTPRPTSLRIATGEIIDRGALLVHLCQQLAEALTLTPEQNYARWKSHLSTLGHTVTVHPSGIENEAILVGQAVDVQEDGALVVVEANGARHAFHAADVSIRATPH